MRTMVMLLALVVPAMAQEQPRSTHWGAGGQMPQRPVTPAHWGAGGQMPASRPAREDAHQRALRQYDANKDGKLDAAEREAMRRAKKAGQSWCM